MPEGKAVSENTASGQVTLMDLLLGIAFSMPIVSAITELKHSGGGMLRYLAAAPSAFAMGVAIVSLDWKLGKAVWLRCQRYSKATQNAAALALLAVQLFGIVGGAVSGFWLAMLIEKHVPK